MQKLKYQQSITLVIDQAQYHLNKDVERMGRNK